MVVRAVDETTTVVEAFDPDAMMSFAANGKHGKHDDTLRAVAADARERLNAALAALQGSN